MVGGEGGGDWIDAVLLQSRGVPPERGQNPVQQLLAHVVQRGLAPVDLDCAAQLDAVEGGREVGAEGAAAKVFRGPSFFALGPNGWTEGMPRSLQPALSGTDRRWVLDGGRAEGRRGRRCPYRGERRNALWVHLTTPSASNRGNPVAKW